MRTFGWTIGIPLTLLQFGVHHHVPPDVVLNNFLLCNAVYDADRFDDTTSLPQRVVSTTSAAAVTASYVTDDRLRVLSPIVPILHFGYASLKPYIAPVKPFVVAGLWTTLVCYVPPHDDNLVMTSAALFLNVASLSHAIDIVDADDDRAQKIITPAVSMGRDESVQYAIALMLGSVALDGLHHPLFDALSILALVSVLFENHERRLTPLVSVVFIVAYGVTHDLDVVRSLLRSTEFTHSISVSCALDLTEWATTPTARL